MQEKFASKGMGELAAVLAARNAALERGLAGELEQAIDAAGGFGLTDQEGNRNEGVAHGAVRRLVAAHVEIEPVAKCLIAVRGCVGPKVLGDAQGADPGRIPGRRSGGNGERFVKCVVGRGYREVSRLRDDP